MFRHLNKKICQWFSCYSLQFLLSLSHDFSCCEAIKCQHTIFRILTKLRKKYVFPLYIFHFMCMNFSWWSFCIFFYISCAFLMITLYHIKVFSFLQLSLQFLFVRKTEMLITFVGVFWKLKFPAKTKSKPKPQLNQNNHYPGLLSYTRRPPTPSKMIFYQMFKFYYGFLLSEKMIRFHDWYFILLISAKYKKAILKSDYFVK